MFCDLFYQSCKNLKQMRNFILIIFCVTDTHGHLMHDSVCIYSFTFTVFTQLFFEKFSARNQLTTIEKSKQCFTMSFLWKWRFKYCCNTNIQEYGICVDFGFETRENWADIRTPFYTFHSTLIRIACTYTVQVRKVSHIKTQNLRCSWSSANRICTRYRFSERFPANSLGNVSKSVFQTFFHIIFRHLTVFLAEIFSAAFSTIAYIYSIDTLTTYLLPPAMPYGKNLKWQILRLSSFFVASLLCLCFAIPKIHWFCMFCINI